MAGLRSTPAFDAPAPRAVGIDRLLLSGNKKDEQKERAKYDDDNDVEYAHNNPGTYHRIAAATGRSVCGRRCVMAYNDTFGTASRTLLKKKTSSRNVCTVKIET